MGLGSNPAALSSVALFLVASSPTSKRHNALLQKGRALCLKLFLLVNITAGVGLPDNATRNHLR